ncbi:MAG: sigma-54 dependent transcriptional regulator [Spirochaetota bacterium]|nr:sigma-54 dependent transcriptional regulator [Spirochaetota bacterium]
MDSKNLSILVVDDEKNFRTLLFDALIPEGYFIDEADNGINALKKVQEKHFDVAIVDVIMPQMGGLSFLEKVVILKPNLFIIMMSGLNDVENIIKAIKIGAFHFLTKPLDIDLLYKLLNKIVEQIKLNNENLKLKEKLSFYESYPNIIGTSEAFIKIVQQALQLARTEAFCLLNGESGTGKEVICELIHKESNRKKGPLLKINCAAIPTNLLESELFGYEKGAFTGAYQTKKGLFELADNGTLFLDEIGDLDLTLQAKLLRVIELGEFNRVGGEKTLKSNVRIISATNKDLQQKIKENAFREDLYYRLNVVNLYLPPLRDRVEDIPILVNHFVKELSEKNQKPIKPVSKKTLSYLLTYPFEGNIRELKNLIERAIVFSKDDTIELKDIFDENTFQVEKHYIQIPIDTTMANVESIVIKKVLEFVDGDKKKAAEILNISLRKIFYKLKEEKLKS